MKLTIQKLLDAIEYEITLAHRTGKRLRGLQERVRDAATRKKRSKTCPAKTPTT